MATPEELDAFAKSYYLADVADIEIENAAQRASVKHIVPHLVGCERILHMGWGTGVLVRAIDEAMPELYEGTDIVEGSYTLAKLVNEETPFLAYPSLFEDFTPEKPYDVVIASHVLEHLEDPVGVLKLVHSWLKPGGKVIVIVPNAESLHRRIAVQMGIIPDVYTLSDRDHEVGHVQLYSLNHLWYEVAGLGFEVFDDFSYQLKPLHNAALKDMPVSYREALNEIQTGDITLMANIGIVAVKR